MNNKLLESDNILVTSIQDYSKNASLVRVEETLMMNHIGDQFTQKEGFWIEKRSDISQYFLYIDILMQYKKQLENIKSKVILSNQQLTLLQNFSELQVLYPDRIYDHIYSFIRLQVDLIRCNNLNFGKWGVLLFFIFQIVQIGIYCIPILISKYADFYYILVYQLVTLSSLCYVLLVLNYLLIAFCYRVEAIKKMRYNDAIIPYEKSYQEFIFNDRLAHSLSDGLSWFFILRLQKSIFFDKIGYCNAELSQDFINKMNVKYQGINDDDEVITIVYNAKWKVKNSKAYKGLNDAVFNSIFLYEIALSILFSVSYGYYLIDNFDLF
ncbi:hypothetical protein ABPG72_016085 [Tetrahymena utriculariae]